jgi:hypothetical protein
MKNFKWTEARYLQARGEFFNGFNQVSWGQPNATSNTPSAGTITGVNPNYNPRTIQIGLKLFF